MNDTFLALYIPGLFLGFFTSLKILSNYIFVTLVKFMVLVQICILESQRTA